MLPGSMPYYGVTVTVPATSATLISLIQAAITATSNDSTVLGAVREMQLQADSTNTSLVILVGDSFVKLSPQRCAYGLIATQTRLYRASALDLVLMGRIYVVESTGAAKLNVELMS